MKPTVMTITGIRPDFVRMAAVFRGLDAAFNHVLVHTGQHYDPLLSGVFFQELKTREPDYNLGIGAPGRRHHAQVADLSVKVIDLIECEGLKPDLVVFLGDSNSVLCSVPLKKEGCRIAHIEACMRSYDRRMLEEINRVVCDHVSDLLFAYHDDYKAQGVREGIGPRGIHVVGNTIVEPCRGVAKDLGLYDQPKRRDRILLDIHRPENLLYPNRLRRILQFADLCAVLYDLPVQMLRFGRTMEQIAKHGIPLGRVEVVDLMSYRTFLEAQYHARFLISDSGTASEEPALLGTPVLVPRDHTERPQAYQHNCAFPVGMNEPDGSWAEAIRWIEAAPPMDDRWLGDGRTSERIVEIIREDLS